MSGPLRGRVAVVTGAGVRLGRVVAESLADAGADVVVHYHTSEEGAQQAAARIRERGRRAEVVQGDLTEPEAVTALFEAARRLGGCDLLVNSAALFERRAMEEIDDAAWRRMLEVNLSAPFFCCRAAVPQMREKGRGDIINICDVGGALRPWRHHAHYCAAKAGLAALTQCLALELAPVIRVNAVAPGTVLPPAATTAAEMKRLLARIPAGRLGDPSAVADTVLFLASGPRYLTGQIVAVDGGRSLA